MQQTVRDQRMTSLSANGPATSRSMAREQGQAVIGLTLGFFLSETLIIDCLFCPHDAALRRRACSEMENGLGRGVCGSSVCLSEGESGCAGGRGALCCGHCVRVVCGKRRDNIT